MSVSEAVPTWDGAELPNGSVSNLSPVNNSQAVDFRL